MLRVAPSPPPPLRTPTDHPAPSLWVQLDADRRRLLAQRLAELVRHARAVPLAGRGGDDGR